MELNYMDIIIISYFGMALISSVLYDLWQFDKIGGTEYGWTKYLKFEDIIETIVFVMTRFLPYGVWGTRALCGAYCLHIIALILQLVFAEWDGITWKITTSLWIAFYIVMIFIDIAHIDVIAIVLNKTVDHIENSATFIKKIGVSTFIQLVMWFFGKIANFIKHRKSDN